MPEDKLGTFSHQQKLTRHRRRAEDSSVAINESIDKIVTAMRDTEAKVLTQYEDLERQIANTKAVFTKDVANLSKALTATTNTPRPTTQRGATPTSNDTTPADRPKRCYPHDLYGMKSWVCHGGDCPMRNLISAKV